MKSRIARSVKNLFFPHTERKYVVLCFDDYGNVRLHSKEARDKLEKMGFAACSRFDQFDALETRTDLEMMFDTLASVSDLQGNSAKLTALATIANPDFAKISESGSQHYFYELLPDSFDRLGGEYLGCMQLWQEGMAKGLIRPEFHGREHLNINLLTRKLRTKDADILASFSQLSAARLNPPPDSRVSWTAAFEFDKSKELVQHREIIEDGVQRFRQVFGRKPIVFNPPGGTEHRSLHPLLHDLGFKIIETQQFHFAHQGSGVYLPRFHRVTRGTSRSAAISIRNCVFEPTSSTSIDWAQKTLAQVEECFAWGRPAIISSHRVNFCGRICEDNRKTGISSLRKLLHGIKERFPDCEFAFLDELFLALGLISNS